MRRWLAAIWRWIHGDVAAPRRRRDYECEADYDWPASAPLELRQQRKSGTLEGYWDGWTQRRVKPRG